MNLYFLEYRGNKSDWSLMKYLFSNMGIFRWRVYSNSYKLRLQLKLVISTSDTIRSNSCRVSAVEFLPSIGIKSLFLFWSVVCFIKFGKFSLADFLFRILVYDSFVSNSDEDRWTSKLSKVVRCYIIDLCH